MKNNTEIFENCKKILKREIYSILEKETQKFLITSITCAASVLFFTFVFTEFFLFEHILSVFFSIELTIVWAFFILDNKVFDQGIKKHNIVSRFFRYQFISFGGLILNLSLFTIFFLWLELFYLFSEFIAIILTGAFNLYMVRNFAWAKKSLN
tara:strand:- start:483 stop:941 length:459 start_codon:yes stop_codon:yes gene_type:complete